MRIDNKKIIIARLGLCIFLFALLPVITTAQLDVSALRNFNRLADSLKGVDLQQAERLADSAIDYYRSRNQVIGEIAAFRLKAQVKFKQGDLNRAGELFDENLEKIESVLPSVGPEMNEFIVVDYAISLYEIGNVKVNRGAYSQAAGYAKKSDSVWNYYFGGTASKSYVVGLINTKNLLGMVYYGLGQLEEAILLFEEIHELYIEDENYQSAINALANASVLYQDTGQLLKSLRALEKARTIAVEKKYDDKIALVIGRMGQLFYSMKNHKEALKHSMQSYTMYNALDLRPAMAARASDVGDNYKKLKQYDSAFWYYEQSVAIHKELGNNDDVAYVSERIASLKILLGSCKEAEPYLQEGLRIAEKEELQFESILLNVSKAECQIQTGQIMEAKSTADYLMNMLTQTQNMNLQKDIYNVVHKVYNAAGEYERAYQLFETYIKHRDSLYNEEKNLVIANAKYEYDLERETTRMRAQQAQKDFEFRQQLERRRWQLALLVGALVLSSFIAFFAYRAYTIKRDSNKVLREINLELKESIEREKQLSEETIQSKEKELATMAMASHEKNALLKDLEQKVSFIESRLGDEMKDSLKDMKKAINDGFSLDESWDSFLHRFEDVHPNFFDRLKDRHPVLTVDDLKLCAYLKIGMSNKEIANVTHLTLGSVKSKINRLKKKLEMSADDNVRDYMIAYIAS